MVLGSDLGQAIELSGLFFGNLVAVSQVEVAATAGIAPVTDSVPVAVSQVQGPVATESVATSPIAAQPDRVAPAFLVEAMLEPATVALKVVLPSQPACSKAAAAASQIIGPTSWPTALPSRGIEASTDATSTILAHDTVLAAIAQRSLDIALRWSSITEHLWTLAKTPEKRILSPQTADQTLSIYWNR